MFQRDYLNWVFRPSFLQPWGKKKDTLFAGPWVGEFGWEAMNWQPFLRWLAPQYKKVIVCIRKGNDALYQDFAHEFVEHQIQGDSNCNQIVNVENLEEYDRIKKMVSSDWDWLKPVGWQPEKRRVYKVFGTSQADLQTDILFHPRGRNWGQDRNWKQDKWKKCVDTLTKQGYKLGCIGLTSATQKVAGEYIDYRDVSMHQVILLMASTKLVVGPSSGPMHLASLCKTPHLVWADQKKYARGSLIRERYESSWNPFQTQAIIVDEYGFNPKVDVVLNQVYQFFKTKNFKK